MGECLPNWYGISFWGDETILETHWELYSLNDLNDTCICILSRQGKKEQTNSRCCTAWVAGYTVCFSSGEQRRVARALQVTQSGMGLLSGCFSVPWAVSSPSSWPHFSMKGTTEIAGSCPGGNKASVLETKLGPASAGWQTAQAGEMCPAGKLQGVFS